MVLKVEASDPEGATAVASVYLYFEGSVVNFEDGYNKYVTDCINKGRAFWNLVSDRFSKRHQRVPPWVPIDKPAPEKVIELISALASLPDSVAQKAAASTAVAHRSAFQQGMHMVLSGRKTLVG